MAVFTLGEAMGLVVGIARGVPDRRSGSHRTGAPVLRGSLEAGTFEDTFFVVPAKGEADRLLKAVKAFAAAGKRRAKEARAAGTPLSPFDRARSTLTLASVEVMEHLLTFWRVCKGSVFPSYDRLAEISGLGRATIARAIRQLTLTGFLVRQRRFVRLKDQGAGPQRVQTSNAYRPVFAETLRQFLPRWMRPPIPDDHAQREEERLQATAAMLARLSNREYAKATVGGELGAMLARLGTAIDERSEREYQKGAPPLPESNMLFTNASA